MVSLFEKTSLNSLTLENRFVRSATWEGLAREDGSPTPRMEDVLIRLARDEVGLIITGHAYVSPEGQAGPWQLGAVSWDSLPGLAGLAGAVHAHGGRVAIQLAHAGLFGATRLSGLEAIGPSVIQTKSGPVGREMTRHDMESVTTAFARAAVLACRAGFDAVQIHAAHGYLLSQFLSPFYNNRTDAYGGSIEYRARLILEVVRGMRKEVGPRFPLLIKLNSEDFLPGGFATDAMLQTAAMLEREGIDGIEMSGGTFHSGRFTPSRRGKPGPGEPEAYYETAARRFKEKIRAPLMLVGGIRTLETAERLVREGAADYIALCRPLIREPGLIRRWRSGNRRPAACLSDNGCFKPALEGRGISCVVEEKG